MNRFPFRILLLSGICSAALVACAAPKADLTQEQGMMTPPPDAIETAAGDLPAQNSAQSMGLILDNPLNQVTNPLNALDIAPANAAAPVDMRLANLESAVASLRADYDKMAPTFRTLAVNSERLSSILGQLDPTGMHVSDITPAAGQMAEAGPELAPALRLNTPRVTLPGAVQKVRFADHAEKTRIVLDVSQISDYSYDIDNEAGRLVIALPDASWKAGIQRFSVGSKLIESWSSQELPDGGSALILNLKQPVRVLHRNALPPNGERGPRIYLDLAPAA